MSLTYLFCRKKTKMTSPDSQISARNDQVIEALYGDLRTPTPPPTTKPTVRNINQDLIKDFIQELDEEDQDLGPHEGATTNRLISNSEEIKDRSPTPLPIATRANP